MTATMLLDTIASADELLARRAGIVQRLIPFRALYGGMGYMGERQFKVEEAKVATAVRARLQQENAKATEGRVDELVRTQPEYIQALTDDVKRRGEWIALEEELNEVEWRLRCRQTDGALLSAEARLTSVSA